ncbi:MAG: hypothetical protein WC703_00475 [Candidatus Neomarinimicrobiota bacterium]
MKSEKITGFRKFLKIPCIVLLIGSLLRAATDRTFSSYLKSEVLMENNIFESDSNRTDDNAGQFWGGILINQTNDRSSRRISLIGNYSAYFQNPEENKLITTGNWQYYLALSPKLFFKSQANLLTKWWQNASNAYSDVDLSANIGARFGKSVAQVGAYYQNNWFRFAQRFNSTQIGVVGELQFQPAEAWTLSGKSSILKIDYPNRQVYHDPDTSSVTYNLQRDIVLFGQIGFEHRKKWIAGGSLRFSYLGSNSRYSSFANASVQIYATRKIRRLLLQMIAEFQLKRYLDDPSERAIYYNPDPEQNVQNQIFVGWENELIGGLSLTGKFAFFRNETQYSGIYYNKWFASVGLQYRFE